MQNTQTNEETTQLLVPKSCRELLFHAAHHNLVVNLPTTPKAPLLPVPRGTRSLAKELVCTSSGPLDQSVWGHNFVLAFVDYTMWYLELIPLCNISACHVVEALFHVISCIQGPERDSDWPEPMFMSHTLCELYELLGIKTISASVYHPKMGWSNGLIKCLKTFVSLFMMMLRIGISGPNPYYLQYEVPQASTLFFLFELLYGHKAWGALDVVRENWEEGPSNSKNEIQYVPDLCDGGQRKPPPKQLLTLPLLSCWKDGSNSAPLFWTIECSVAMGQGPLITHIWRGMISAIIGPPWAAGEFKRLPVDMEVSEARAMHF